MWKLQTVGDLPRSLRLPYPVSAVGFSKADTHPRQRFRIGNFVEIVLRLGAVTPEIEEEIDGVRHRKRLPHVAVKLPGSQYVYGIDSPREAFYFCYRAEVADQLRDAGVLPEAPYAPLAVTAPLTALIRRGIALLETLYAPGTADRLDALCLGILTELALGTRTPAGDPIGEKILNIASRLRADCTEPPDWEALFRRHGFSRSVFFEHWHRHFAESPAAFMREHRWHEACRLLRETGYPIGEIGRRLNFGSEEYFCAAFRRKFRTTPRRYRLRECAEPLRLPPG